MSMKLVRPPATAAADSVAMSALYSMPGFAEMHLVVDHAGNRRQPEASTTVSLPRAFNPLPIWAMRPDSMRRSPSNSRPSLTRRAVDDQCR
jgi:hypothetical protein